MSVSSRINRPSSSRIVTSPTLRSVIPWSPRTTHLRSIEVLNQHDFVPGLVVDELVDQRPRHHEAEAAGPEALALAHQGVLERRVLGVADGRMAQLLDVEAFAGV